MEIGEIEVIGKQKRKPIKYKVTEKGCWECTSHSKNSAGYPKIRINNKLLLMSRYIYTENFGKIQEGLVIRHKCDNGGCINLNHLEIGTLKENSNDMVIRNRSTRGEKAYNSKLTQIKVAEIRLDNRKQRTIAKEYGVSFQVISAVKAYKIWKT